MGDTFRDDFDIPAEIGEYRLMSVENTKYTGNFYNYERDPHEDENPDIRIGFYIRSTNMYHTKLTYGIFYEHYQVGLDIHCERNWDKVSPAEGLKPEPSNFESAVKLALEHLDIVYPTFAAFDKTLSLQCLKKAAR